MTEKIEFVSRKFFFLFVGLVVGSVLVGGIAHIDLSDPYVFVSRPIDNILFIFWIVGIFGGIVCGLVNIISSILLYVRK